MDRAFSDSMLRAHQLVRAWMATEISGIQCGIEALGNQEPTVYVVLEGNKYALSFTEAHRMVHAIIALIHSPTMTYPDDQRKQICKLGLLLTELANESLGFSDKDRRRPN